MRRLLVVLLLLASAGHVFPGIVPLTTKEMGLMLRSGYSSAAVMRELSERHFADTFDSAVEKQLQQAGANPALLDALRSGTYRPSAEEAAAASEKLMAEQERAAQAVEQSKESAAEKESEAARARPKPGVAAEPVNEVYRLLKGDLVWCHQGNVAHFDDESLQQKKLYIFFFSANWSPPGRKFTAQLIEYYNRVAPQHPEFEVIFFSADRSQFGMETYMAQSNMPWPAVAFPKIASKAGAMETDLVKDLPCLILVNGTGRILSYSRGGENEKGPEKVLADLDKVFARGTDGAVARVP